MNDKDKEAFEKWLDDCYFDGDRRPEPSVKEAWQAACEYMRDEFKFQTPPAVFIYQDMNDKLQAENKKLREALDNAHDDFTKQGLHKQASRVLLALNITTTREALKKVEDK